MRGPTGRNPGPECQAFTHPPQFKPTGKSTSLGWCYTTPLRAGTGLHGNSFFWIMSKFLPRMQQPLVLDPNHMPSGDRIAKAENAFPLTGPGDFATHTPEFPLCIARKSLRLVVEEEITSMSTTIPKGMWSGCLGSLVAQYER